MAAFLSAFFLTIFWELLVTLGIIAVWKVTERIARAPALDVAVSLLTWIPWVYAAWRFGWAGFFGCLIGQFAALHIFCFVHAWATGYRGPTIRETLNGIVGRSRNYLAVWATLPALPVFLSIRLAEVTLYRMLIRLIGMPAYNQGEWVNVSRQKFGGLVGQDLIWCLYCDWMTGVYSLGAEMLRNIESFWCPIRFYGKKCDNCQVDFPDLKEWAQTDASMEDVTQLLEEHYPPGNENPRSWWGHPERK